MIFVSPPLHFFHPLFLIEPNHVSEISSERAQGEEAHGKHDDLCNGEANLTTGHYNWPASSGKLLKTKAEIPEKKI